MIPTTLAIFATPSPHSWPEWIRVNRCVAKWKISHSDEVRNRSRKKSIELFQGMHFQSNHILGSVNNSNNLIWYELPQFITYIKYQTKMCKRSTVANWNGICFRYSDRGGPERLWLLWFETSNQVSKLQKFDLIMSSLIFKTG